VKKRTDIFFFFFFTSFFGQKNLQHFEARVFAAHRKTYAFKKINGFFSYCCSRGAHINICCQDNKLWNLYLTPPDCVYVAPFVKAACL
jgi:hypothetical protein